MPTEELHPAPDEPLPGLHEPLELVPEPASVSPTVGPGRKRVAGLVGHYAALIALASLVILPILLTLFNALSTPIDYITAQEPWRPVAVGWKDRRWLDGGATSVLGRSLALLLTLVWIQLKAARGSARKLAPLREPQRLIAIASGFVAIAVLSGEILRALVDRSPSTLGWFVGSMAVVALTQAPGFVRVPGDGRRGAYDRPAWRVVTNSAVVGIALVTVVVVAVGAEVWTDAWDQGRLGPALTRSLVMSVLIVSCQVVTSVFAAYAFAFLRFPLKGLAFAFVMASLLLPIEVTLLGNVQTIRNLGWTDSYQGLVLPFAATAFGTFLIRQGFKGIPPEIRDAARLDGYGHLAFMWRFAVPLTRPVIGAFTVVAGMVAWNQYLWPQAIIDDQRQETAQIALKSLEGAIENANIRIASALIISLPVVLLLIAFQRQIIRGLTAGAVK